MIDKLLNKNVDIVTLLNIYHKDKSKKQYHINNINYYEKNNIKKDSEYYYSMDLIKIMEFSINETEQYIKSEFNINMQDIINCLSTKTFNIINVQPNKDMDNYYNYEIWTNGEHMGSYHSKDISIHTPTYPPHLLTNTNPNYLYSYDDLHKMGLI